MAKHNEWKKREGVVFSTNPDFAYTPETTHEADTLPPAQQTLKIKIDTRDRAGKKVTLVSGFIGTEQDLTDLGKELKSKCSVGGSVKDGDIILQGDVREKAKAVLLKLGYKVKG